jgi:hypothetical protein
VRDDSLEESFIVHVNVPGPLPVYANVSPRKESLHGGTISSLAYREHERE